MKRGLATALALSAAVALAVGLYQRDAGAPDLPRALPGETAAPASSWPDETRSAAVTAATGVPAPGGEPKQAVSFEQLAREMYERSAVSRIQDFRTDLQALVREAQLLPAQDYGPGARDLLARVDALAAEGYLTAPEALALRLSLLRYSLPPDDYLSAAGALVREARLRAERAEREWAARSDPRLEAYRAAERRIVEQSAAMEDYPDGMTRQAYLRQKLQELRSEIYPQ